MTEIIFFIPEISVFFKFCAKILEFRTNGDTGRKFTIDVPISH